MKGLQAAAGSRRLAGGGVAGQARPGRASTQETVPSRAETQERGKGSWFKSQETTIKDLVSATEQPQHKSVHFSSKVPQMHCLEHPCSLLEVIVKRLFKSYLNDISKSQEG